MPEMAEQPATMHSQSQWESGQVDAPVWIRMAGAIKLTSLSRSMLYDLIGQGRIRSKVLERRRDAHHGVRLISYDSLLEYIDRCGDEEAPAQEQFKVPPKQSAPRAKGAAGGMSSIPVSQMAKERAGARSDVECVPDA